MATRTGASPPSALRCVNHPRSAAGWQCAACGDLCPACVARVRADLRTHYDTCARCDGAVLPILVPGAVQSFAALLRSHLFGHVSLRSLIYLLAAISVWAELTLQIEVGAGGLAALIGTALASAALGTACFAVVVDTARGPDELVRSESLALFSDALRPSWPLWALFGVVLAGPVVLPRWIGKVPDQWIWDLPLLGLSIAIGAILPWIAVRQAVGAAGGEPARGASLPAAGIGIGAVALAFFHFFLWSSASSAQMTLWGWAEPLRIFGGLSILVLGRLTGLLLHASANELGFPLPERYRVPLMGDVVPTGVPAPRPEPVPRRSYDPIDF